MTPVSKIVIRYNQQKRAILFFLSGFMMVAGIGIIVKAFSKKPFIHPFFLPLGVILLLGFFTILVFARRLFINNNVLVVDDNGITDNSNSGSIGFIPWKDVVNVTKKKVAGRKFVCVFVSNPNEYFGKANSIIQQKRMEFNKTYCETPVVISARNLSVDYYTLLEIIQRKHNLFKEQENYLKTEGITASL